MKSPFPWFGGKSRVAPEVWDRFGNVPNYVEPFFGSGAVLLARPFSPGVETINDKDCFVANFWRALQHDPEGVAHHADYPVNEADLHARHLWLVNNRDFQERMKTEPEYFDSKVAGWWVWGQSQWIGGGWCTGRSSWGHEFADGEPCHARLPDISNPGKGVHRQLPRGARWAVAAGARLLWRLVADFGAVANFQDWSNGRFPGPSVFGRIRTRGCEPICGGRPAGRASGAGMGHRERRQPPAANRALRVRRRTRDAGFLGMLGVESVRRLWIARERERARERGTGADLVQPALLAATRESV